MDTKKTWEAVLGDIELEVSRPNFLTWLKQSQLVGADDKEGVATIGLPNTFTKEWVKNKYHKLILHSLRNIDSCIKNVDYIVVGGVAPVRKEARVEERPSSVAQPALLDAIDARTNLNPKYSLDSFIVGGSNELAYAAAQAVVDNVGTKYNPLFIYGKVGLGKTHLIQGVGNSISEKHKHLHVLYTTSETFTRDVVQAIRFKRTEDIKKKYRKTDVLIIDDIQFIGGKPSTEIEFFHTFNALYEENKQIILSSDRPPAAIAELEERLRSRFEGGMLADVSYPDYEMRLAILKAKARLTNVSIDDWVLEYIAESIQNNVRELEGVLNKAVFYRDYKHETVDRKFLDKLIGETSRLSVNITPDKIIKTVSRFFDVNPQELTKRTRKRDIVEPRQICMYLMRDLLKLSYPEVGNKLGKRDHTTAIYACEKIGDDMRNNPLINQKVMTIKEQLYQ